MGQLLLLPHISTGFPSAFVGPARVPPRVQWMTLGAAPVRPAERSGCPGSPPGALAHEHRPAVARWRAPVSRSTMRTRTLARAQLFDRVRPAAALGRPGALALRRAARARNKSRHGLVALASPCVGARCGMPTQTSSCSSEFILLDGSKLRPSARRRHAGWCQPSSHQDHARSGLLCSLHWLDAVIWP